MGARAKTSRFSFQIRAAGVHGGEHRSTPTRTSARLRDAARGAAIDVDEYVDGVRAAAAPVDRAPDHKLVAILWVAGFSRHIDSERLDFIASAVAREAAEISQRLAELAAPVDRATICRPNRPLRQLRALVEVGDEVCRRFDPHRQDATANPKTLALRGLPSESSRGSSMRDGR